MGNERVLVVAQIGFGYWGRKLARNISLHNGFSLKAIVDSDTSCRKVAEGQYSDCSIYDDITSILAREDIDAVVIATPASSHYELCKQVLHSGKHCLVTKPITGTSREAQELAELAASRQLTILIDHTFLYSSALEAIKTTIEQGDIGTLLTVEATRAGLGIFKTDVDVLEDLAIHDLSIIERLITEQPVSISCHMQKTFPDLKSSLCHLTIKYDAGVVAHIATNWLAPVKKREVLFIGTKKMILWDDCLEVDKLKLFDVGIDFDCKESVLGRAPISYRENGWVSLPVADDEPLFKEIEDFYESILSSRRPVSDIESAIGVMNLLDKARESANHGATHIFINNKT